MICLAEDGRKKVQADGILLDTVSKSKIAIYSFWNSSTIVMIEKANNIKYNKI